MRRFRYWPLAPFILGVYPILYIYSVNLGAVDASVILAPLAVALLAAALLNALCALIMRDWHKGALLTDVLLFSAYMGTSFLDTFFPWLYGTPFGEGVAVMLIVLILALTWMIGKTLSKTADPSRWTLIANLCGAMLLIIPMTQVAWYQATFSRHRSEIAPLAEESPARSRPDVYYIILDGYARADILSRDMGYDNSPFINFLTRKGFFVARKSRSNYAYTFLSLASSLNMDYLSDLNEAPDQEMECISRIHNNSVMRIFRSKGYRVIHFSPTWLTRADDPYSETTFNPRSINEFENLVLKRFLFRAFIKQGVMNLYKARTKYTLGHLQEMSKDVRSKFIFAHVLCPHPPFVFDRSGNTPEPKIYAHRPPGSHDWYPKERYVDQIDYLNRLVEQTIERILKDSKTIPIIIVQGDHGAASDGTSADPTALMVRERMSILNAYYVPIELRRKLYPSITPVNTFRLVCNYIFHAQFSHLPDRSYYSGPMDAIPYKFVDVRALPGDEQD